MPGCYCSSTSRKQTFHIAKTRAVKLGQQSDKLHFLQALGHISSSHMGGYSATATMHFPAVAEKAGEPAATGKWLCLTLIHAAAQAALQSKALGISCPPCSATWLSCMQDALLQKGWKQALSLHKRIRNHEVDPQRVQAATSAPLSPWL